MARPTKHNGKWRIRWLDEHGHRQSEVHDAHNEAVAQLARHQHEVEEIKRGLRIASTPALRPLLRRLSPPQPPQLPLC